MMYASFVRPAVWLVLLLSAWTLPITPAAPAAATQAAAPQAETSSALQKQVREWISVLSKKPPFTRWKTAVPDIQALGPGTHGWLVLLSDKGGYAGYMVVHAVADGTFRLGEYGAGPSVLFSDSVLKQSLTENGLTGSAAANAAVTTQKLYYHPFAAFWEVTVGSDTYWLDAKTGEMLPLTPELVHDYAEGKALQAPPPVKSDIQASWLKSTFDPYERLPWLTGEKPFASDNAKKVQDRVRSRLHLRYVSEPFGGAMLYALPVVGYQSWTAGRLDLALDMNGLRFIPLDALNEFGRFFR